MAPVEQPVRGFTEKSTDKKVVEVKPPAAGRPLDQRPVAEEAVVKRSSAPGQDIPVWGAYVRALETSPIRTKVLTSIFMMGVSQMASQKISKGKIVDRRGVVIWSLWGFVLGFLNHQWQWAIATHGPKNLFWKLVVDHLGWKAPVLYAFVTYERFMRGFTLGQSWSHSLKANPPLQRAAIKVFPLIQVVNFTLVPLPLRVLYMNATLFFWCIYLAIKMS